jgi:hypothetical protein
MPSVNDYREIKLVNGEFVNKIKNTTQKEWMKACEKLGLRVFPAHGKGSHCAVYKDSLCLPSNSDCCVVTIPGNIYANFQRDLVKKILFHGIQSGKYSENDIWRALSVIK